jgi:hypothetical protein
LVSFGLPLSARPGYDWPVTGALQPRCLLFLPLEARHFRVVSARIAAAVAGPLPRTGRGRDTYGAPVIVEKVASASIGGPPPSPTGDLPIRACLGGALVTSPWSQERRFRYELVGDICVGTAAVARNFSGWR